MFFGILIFLGISSLVSANGPIGHTYGCVMQLNNTDSFFSKECANDTLSRQAFMLGCELPDIAVGKYFEEGGKEYKLTHNWNFQQALMNQANSQDERCLAYGVAGGHLVLDGISHMETVPEAIDTMKLPNNLLHPLLEQKFDATLAQVHPWVVEQTTHMMDAINGPKGPRYVEMVENALGSNSRLDVKSEMVNLQTALGGQFYDTEFKPTGAGILYSGYNAIAAFTKWIQPVIGSANYGGTDYHFRKGIEQSTNIQENWGARYTISPHGFDELTAADNKKYLDLGPLDLTPKDTVMIYLSLVTLIPIGLSIYKRRVWYLLLIPVIILMTIIILYTIV
jgi:hypothetical protein